MSKYTFMRFVPCLALIKTVEGKTYIQCDVGRALEENSLTNNTDSPIVYFEVISKKHKEKKHKSLTGGFVEVSIKAAKYETCGIVETVPIGDDISVTITEKENGKLKFHVCLDSIADPNTGLVTNWAVQSKNGHLKIYSKVAIGYEPIIIKE